MIGGCELKSVTYEDIISLSGNFLSLDISVRSTGWCRWQDGVLSYGVFKLEETDPVLRRFELAKFIRELCGDSLFDFVVVEDVIASCNFKTAKILIQLNSVIDDMIFRGEVNIGRVIREDNKVWKKHLRKVSNYEGVVLASKDKEIVRECMSNLGFEGGLKQDIYDAVGMACGTIYKLQACGGSDRKRKLKTDLSKGYVIKQFSDECDALFFAGKTGKKLNRAVLQLDMLSISKDIRFNFKKAVMELGDDKVFVVSSESKKLGYLALHKNLALDEDLTYLVCYTK